MGAREKTVVIVGLVAIVAIACWISYGSIDICNSEANTSAALNNTLLLQKDFLVAKIMNQLKMKDAELKIAKADLAGAVSKLDATKAEIEGAKQKLENIRAEASSPISAASSRRR